MDLHLAILDILLKCLFFFFLFFGGGGGGVGLIDTECTVHWSASAVTVCINTNIMVLSKMVLGRWTDLPTPHTSPRRMMINAMPDTHTQRSCLLYHTDATWNGHKHCEHYHQEGAQIVKNFKLLVVLVCSSQTKSQKKVTCVSYEW